MRYRILLIDNTITAESPAFLALSDIGLVIRARSVLEAIAQCDKLQPDIVVADCPVDGMDADEIYAELTDNGCRAIVVALAYEETVHNAGNANAPHIVLHKPLTWVQLQDAVREVLASLPPRSDDF